MGNQFLSLGLFVMLLSFFIVLNSLSRFEESKTYAVINSLSNALIPQYSVQNNLPSPVITAEGEDANAGDTLDRIKALFRSSIPDVKAQKNRFGTELRMEMDRDLFEAALFNEGEDADRLAHVLAGLISLDVSIPYQMDIILNTPVNPAQLQSDSPAAATALIDKAGRYSQVLETSGVESRLLSAGLGAGPDKTVFLVFRKFSPVKLELKAGGGMSDDQG